MMQNCCSNCSKSVTLEISLHGNAFHLPTSKIPKITEVAYFLFLLFAVILRIPR